MSKTRGMLCADISGTTRLYRKIGTDEAKYQLERCIKRMERAIESNKGHLAAPAIDELVAEFPSADDAVAAAIEMQRRIEDLPPLSGVRLSIRVGVHYGALTDEANPVASEVASVTRSLLNLAGAGQIVTCALTAQNLSRVMQDNLRTVESMFLQTASGEIPVYFVAWRPEGVAAQAKGTVTAAPSVAAPERVTLRFDGRALLVDTGTPSLVIGRERGCDLLLKGSKVSRKHARIEFKPGNGFFLTDQSSNGTYVYSEGSGESRIYNEEIRLNGKGRIAFGHTTDKNDGEVLDFEIN